MIEKSLFISILCSVKFWFVDTSVLIKNKNKSEMISLFIVAYSTEHSLIFEGCSLGYLSLCSYVSLLRASHSLRYLCFQSDNIFDESFMRSFASWIRVDIHWV